jgi:putative ABC transport system permease protein
MIPTIDSLKTVGLVQLPGMMTGMIVAGANPIDAVRYQILIMFEITSSAAITSIILSVISYKMWFTVDERLKV